MFLEYYNRNITWKDILEYDGVLQYDFTCEWEDETSYNGYRVIFMGQDCGDKYAIIRVYTPGKEDEYHFVFFHPTGEDISLAAEHELVEHRVYNNAAEAILWLSYRFLLDNADGADSYSELVCNRHDDLQKLIRDAVDPPKKQVA